MKSPIGRRSKDELAHLLDCLPRDGPLLPVAGGLRGDLPMSTDDDTTDDVDVSRTREEKLKSLIRRDVDPEITELAKDALQYCQEGSS